MRGVLLLAVVALLCSAVSAATSCGNNGFCQSSSTSCDSNSQQVSSSSCASSEICCQPPTCYSGEETGSCLAASATCASGRTAAGACSGSLQCCLPAAPAVSCQSGAAFGTCQSTCGSGTSGVAGVCSDATLSCCVPSTSTAATCSAQGQVGVCQAATTACSSGNTVSGFCNDATQTCCLPKAAVTPVAQSCSAQGQTGTCQDPTTTCPSSNSVQNVCSGTQVCCLPSAAPTASPCAAQGMAGTCQDSTACSTSGGYPTPGLCPGSSTNQCCLPKPLNFGACTSPDGFVGVCSSTCTGGKTYSSDLCPGNSNVQCCVTNFAAGTPPPTPDYGKCAVNGVAGTCKSVSSCSGTPTAGLCGGPNDIQCCPDTGAAPTPVYAPTQASGFYGACQTSSGPGSCKDTSATCSAGFQSGLCPASKGCCPDGGPASVTGVDLPGGTGYEVNEKTGFTSSVATCLKSTSGGNAGYVLVRGWSSTCLRDSQLSTNLQTAATASLKADVVMQPAAWCGMSPKAQANALIGAIGSSTFGRVWIRIDPVSTASNWHPTNLNQNLRWVVEAAATLTAAYGTAKVGISSSSSAWNKYMGTDATLLAKVNSLPLYYFGDSNANFADFTSFGGWNYGYLKQTSAQASVCGISAPATWLPVSSSTAAAAGTAPPAETNGPSCTVNGVSGFCKSVAGCSGSTVMGVCADSTQACCLSSAPQRPALPGPNPVTVTLGQCTNNGQTGICRPSADCASSDTQVTTSDCAADPTTNDQNVKCCIPATAIVPPPNDDPSTAPPPYTPYPTQEHAGVSKIADAIPVEHVSKATTTAAAGGTNVNANVCVNKAGLALIESFEGFYANFYNDAVGIKTIGFGTACHAYPCDTLKPPLTRAQAEMVLLADMTAHYAPCVRNWVKVSLNSNQFSALVSFVYNAGCGALQGSVGTQLNAGCYTCVRANLAKWNKAGGKVLAGLTRRRAAEADLFENPTVAGCLATAPTAPPAQGGQSWGSCTFQGRSGDCIDVSDCEGTSVGGLCSGPSTVKCCLDAASNPPAPAATACGNGGVCKATTSCNTGTNIVRSGLCAGASTITCCQPKSASAADGWWDGATRDALPAGSSWVSTYNGITVKPKIVLHTTEGGSYAGARSAYSGTHPHFTVTFEKGTFQAYQHVSILTSSKALKHPYGGVETNRAKAIQIEIVGTATKSSTFDQRYLDGIKTLLRWVEGVLGIPRRGATFLAYPASAGNSKVRMADNDWLAFSGTCGHQHVPDNDHGDPGNININYLLSGAGTVYPATASKIAIVDTPGLSGLPGDFGKCTSAGLTGVCQDSALCGGTVISGLCTGPSNVACCMENFGSCAAPQGQGICKESATCNGQQVSGLCPGPSSVTCCVPEVGTCSVGTQTGKCQATSTCTGTVVAGLCTGPSSVSCCLPAKPATNFGTCTVSYTNSTVTGSCIPKANCAAPMTSTPGLCPGDSSIGCCHNPAPVRTFTPCGVGGTCRDVADCTGTVKSGLCDGPANIKCCENPAKPKASLAAPLNIPRGLLSSPINNGSAYAPAAPTWTSAQLTLCSAGGLQGFCMDGSVGNAVCNGVVTYPSSCASPSMCCTPQPCALTNTTSGICIPPTECTNQAGYVTPGYCGVNGGADGATSCCTGAGVAQCDTEGLLACLLADGDATTCAVSFNCPPLPDYTGINSAVQTAPLAGPVAHQMDSPDPTSSTGSSGGDPALSAAASIAPYTLASCVMAFVAMIAAMLY